jgi:stearoyl-CoA desaturase (delta-9 desaturase)
MSTIQRYANLGAVVVPFIALLLAIVLLWNRAVGAIELSIMAFMYCLTGLGITVGYHRMLTHKAFQASKPVEYFWASPARWPSRGPRSRGSPTTASTTPTPTRRAIRTARTSARARA